MLAVALIWLTVDVFVDEDDDRPPQPDKPSIAVLPFANTGNEAEYSYFSDGITDDLITDLSKLSGLFVISRNSTFQYKNRAIDVRQVARELGVRYILEGSVRRRGQELRINAQLIDGQTGGQVWADRYDGKLQGIFDLQDRVTEKIIGALAMRLTEQEQNLLDLVETSSYEAYDEFLKGWERHRRLSREDFARAEQHFQNALELDPQYTRANAALALIYWQAWQQKWHENTGGAVFTGWVRARRQLDAAMTNPTPLVYRLRSAMSLHNRRYEESIEEARRAIEFDQNNAMGYLALADVLAYVGKSAEAIDNANKAIRRDPNFASPYLAVLGRAEFDQGNYQSAIESLERAVQTNPGDHKPAIVLIAAYGQLAMQEQAATLIERVNRQLKSEKSRPLTIDSQKNRWPYLNQENRRRLIDGLVKAGVPVL